MSSTITPNMQLVIPGVGTQDGPQYATDVDNSLTIIDQHNHTIGSGVLITPAAMNINASISMNNQILSLPSAINFQPQLTDPVATSIYSKGVDLYYRDGSGNVIRVTQSGSVTGSTGTITGLPSGTASAAYGAGVFVFQSATSTAANIDGASFVLRNNTASSFGLTLQPPNAMAASYALTLPAIPAQTNIMILDSSGNMGSITYDAVGQAMSSVGANAIANTRTRAVGDVAPAGGIAKSLSSGTFTTSSTSLVLVQNLSVTLTTTGRPVKLEVISASTSPAFAGSAYMGASTADGTNGAYVVFANVGVQIAGVISAGFNFITPPSSYSAIDFAPPGTYTYQVQAAVTAGSIGFTARNCMLVAYEL